MKHYAFGAAVAALLLAAPVANATHVAPLGGAIAAVNGEFSSEEALNDSGDEVVGFDITITGDFFAESNIADFSTPTNYIASADITVEGSLLFSGSAETGPLILDDVLFAAFSFFGPAVTLTSGGPTLFEGGFDFAAIDFGSLPFTIDPGLISILPVVDFVINVTGGSSNSVAGTFLLQSFVDVGLIDLIGLGSPPSSVGFSAELTLAPVAAVPVPAALPLALTGAAVLGGLGWRNRRKAARAA